MELSRDSSRLAREEVLARDGLPRLVSRSGPLGDERGQGSRPLEPEMGRDPVEAFEGERDLEQVRVAGALAHPVDRALHPGRAGLHRCDRRRRGEPEVVVAVPVHRNLDPRRDPVDEIGGGLGRRDPERVDDDGLLRTGVDRGLVGLAVEADVGARSVHAEERDPDPLARGEGDGATDSAQHLVARDAERLQLAVRDRALDHRSAHAELDERLDVTLHGAREAPDLGSETRAGDELDRLPVVCRHARKAGLDPVDARLVERTRDGELVLGREDDPDGLLAVAQRRVVEADRAMRLRLERARVQIARPELVAVDAHRPTTIPSGNGESFSAPSSVTRKLSSTRSPPPSGQ